MDVYNFVTYIKIVGVFLTSISLVLLGAGASSRFSASSNKIYPKKQWLYSNNKPLWLQVTQNFEKIYKFDNIIVVSSKQDIEFMRNFGSYLFIEGGSSRQESLKNAIKNLNSKFVLVSDIARCCLDESMILRVIEASGQADCIVPALNLSDTIYQNENPIDRESVKIIQTPQLSNLLLLKKALSVGKEFTDDSSAIRSLGKKVKFVEGSLKAHKLTILNDIKKLDCIKAPASTQFVGFGVDIHPFEKDKKMYLCGIYIDSIDYGFKAHSDGDVAIHALIDALLGGCGMGDIGELYPDSDMQYAGISSKILLQDTVSKIRSLGFDIINVDMTILAQAPRLLPFKQRMREEIAKILAIEIRYVNIKATTTEKLGFVGKKEGVMVQAVANLKYFDWTGE